MYVISGSENFLEYLRGKSASLLVALSYTKTSEIKGISQAGIPGLMHLTPILDSEFLATGRVKSLKNIAKTKSGIPSPVIITRAVHLLRPFRDIEFLDLGLLQKPKIKYFKIHEFFLKPSGRIDKGANIDAKRLFKLGKEFAKHYQPKGDYIIICESTPGGTTTAYASAKALGYKVDGLFSSSFAKPNASKKQKVVKKALKKISKKDSIFKKLSKVSDNMLVFYAGFVSKISKKNIVVLGGGTQMASLMLIIDALKKDKCLDFNPSNIALFTTKWVYKDKNSDIAKILDQLSFKINAYASDFSFKKSKNKLLKLYDKLEAKEGVGAGAALIYGKINGLSNKKIRKKIEKIIKK